MATSGLYNLRFRFRRIQQADENALGTETESPITAENLDIRPAAFEMLASLRGVQSDRLRLLFASQDQGTPRRYP